MTGEEAKRDPVFRTVGEGAIAGTRVGDHAYVWHGVPYAAAPLSEHRWRAPRPPEPWRGVRDASRRPAPSIQTLPFSTPDEMLSGEGRIIGSEDSLTLTIWSPCIDPPASAKLPVIVWFHGGGNLFGDGAETDASILAGRQNVVVVAINHRLGLLGWFAHRALRATAADAAERSGNFAVLDHLRALEWVRDNVASFGGDPDRVTLMGHSGGGWNVRALLCSPLAVGLFHAAIIMSVSAYQLLSPPHAEAFVDDAVPGHPLSSNEVLLSLWLERDRALDRAVAKAQIAVAPDDEVATFLRSQSYTDLVRAMKLARTRNRRCRSAEALTDNSSRRPPQMFADGVVTTDRLQAHVPILIGSTRYEDRVFLSANPRFVSTAYGHPAIRDRERYAVLGNYLGRFYKAFGVDQPAAEWTRAGRRVFAYRSDWDELAAPDWIDFRALIGAGHGSELPLIFGTADIGRDYSFQRHLYDRSEGSSFCAMSAAMMSYWGAFAATGSPGRGRDGALPDWRAWGEGEYMVLDAPCGGGIRMSDETVTKNSVVEQMMRDPRLADEGARRTLIADLRGYPNSQLNGDDYRVLEPTPVVSGLTGSG